MEPLVFILDLDGTIIGDCSYQVMLYNIDSIVKENKLKSSINKMLLNSYKPNTRLVRPYFKYFISTIKKNYPNSLFFVYTASEKSWANKEIGYIEKTHGIKFNRPIFTRNDCITDSFGNLRKSVKKILPRINKVAKKEIPTDKILIVDNNDVFIDYKSNFLLCPTYDYVLFNNVWEIMKKEYMKIMEIYKIITNLISSNKVCKYCDYKIEPHDTATLEQKHKWLYKKHKKINNMNKVYLKDIFWKKLTSNIIENKIQSFDKETIAMISN
jgi:hypothetical protein